MYSHKKIIIGIPVFNEDKYLRETLESLAVQSHTDFIALISDNASIDSSSQISIEISMRDNRFFYSRRENNVGANGNFKFLLENTDSPYFMWLGAHDLIDKRYLERQLAILDSNPNIALSYSRTRWIDEEGAFIRDSSGGDFVHNDISGLSRYIKTVRGPWNECTAINGVFRRSALFGTKFLATSGPDHFILTKASFFGFFNRIEEPIYFRRDFSSRDSTHLERILGKQSNEKSTLIPLAREQIADFLLLDIGFARKALTFPILLLNLESAYGFIRSPIRSFIRKIIPNRLIKEIRKRQTNQST